MNVIEELALLENRRRPFEAQIGQIASQPLYADEYIPCRPSFAVDSWSRIPGCARFSFVVERLRQMHVALYESMSSFRVGGESGAPSESIGAAFTEIESSAGPLEQNMEPLIRAMGILQTLEEHYGEVVRSNSQDILQGVLNERYSGSFDIEEPQGLQIAFFELPELAGTRLTVCEEQLTPEEFEEMLEKLEEMQSSEAMALLGYFKEVQALQELAGTQEITDPLLLADAVVARCGFFKSQTLAQALGEAQKFIGEIRLFSDFKLQVERMKQQGRDNTGAREEMRRMEEDNRMREAEVRQSQDLAKLKAEFKEFEQELAWFLTQTKSKAFVQTAAARLKK